jgi:hypothetical protein
MATTIQAKISFEDRIVPADGTMLPVGQRKLGVSPFRGQLSGKQLRAINDACVVPKAKHKVRGKLNSRRMTRSLCL